MRRGSELNSPFAACVYAVPFDVLILSFSFSFSLYTRADGFCEMTCRVGETKDYWPAAPLFLAFDALPVCIGSFHSDCIDGDGIDESVYVSALIRSREKCHKLHCREVNLVCTVNCFSYYSDDFFFLLGTTDGKD